MNKLLIVEDDPDIIRSLTGFLTAEGFAVTTAETCRSAIEKIETESYDAILLDISLPDGSGFSVCAAVKANSSAPVIFLTAAGDEYSVITGLDMGADDFVSKPFRPRELVSRIRSVMRRSAKASAVEYGNIKLDIARAAAFKDGRELFLSPLEYRLLLVLFTNRGILLTRERLMEEIWSVSGEFVNDNTLTVYIKRLREKIEENPQNPQIIKTVRGLGYKVE